MGSRYRHFKASERPCSHSESGHRCGCLTWAVGRHGQLSHRPEGAGSKRFKERIDQFYCLTEQRQLLGLHNREENQVQYFQKKSTGDFLCLPLIMGVLWDGSQSLGEMRKITKCMTIYLKLNSEFLLWIPSNASSHVKVQRTCPVTLRHWVLFWSTAS